MKPRLCAAFFLLALPIANPSAASDAPRAGREIAAVPATGGNPPPQVTIGPFGDGQGSKTINFYLRARADGSTRANVVVTPSRPGDKEAVYVVRVLDHDEDIAYWQAYDRQPGAAPHVFTEQAHGGVPSARADVDDPFRGALPMRGRGVHQVQVFAGYYTTVKLEVWNADGYGVGMQPGSYHAWAGQPETMWIRATSHPTAPLYLELDVKKMQGADPVEDVLRLVATSSGEELYRAVGVAGGSGYRGEVTLDGAEIAPGAEPETWRVELPRPAYQFTVTGFPLILCDSAASAVAIGNSVRRIPDEPGYAYRGALVDHAFQLRIADLMAELLGPAVGDAPALYAAGANHPYGDGGANVACHDPQDPSQVFRNYNLVNHNGGLVAARWALGAAGGDWEATPNQLTDASGAHWAGSVGMHLFERQRCPSGKDRECTGGAACVANECVDAFDTATDRWDVLRPLKFKGNTGNGGFSFNGLYGGNTLRYSELPWQLALAAQDDNPCNAYHGEREALYRRAAALVLFDLMSLGPGYTYPDISNTTYSGHAAFRVKAHYGAFEKVAPDLEGVMHEKACTGGATLRDCVRETWTYGMRAMLDRYWVSPMETARNQTAHFPAAFLSFLRGLDPDSALFATYRDVAFRFADRFRESADVAGWFGENKGPSPSYTGMTHWFMGMALKDMDALNAVHGTDYTRRVAQEFRAALRKSYRFHNFFAAKEPGGAQALAGHNFSHRIANGFDFEQFSGARGIVEDEAEIAVWSDIRYGPQTIEDYRSRLSGAAQSHDNYCDNSFQMGYHPAWAEHFDIDARPGGLGFPHETMTETMQAFPTADPQVYAVRRGDYYTALYVGSPSSAYYTDGADAALRTRPYSWGDGAVTHTEDDPGGHNLRDAYRAKPMVGGGLSLFWTARFGTSLYAANWSPLTHHGIVLENVGRPSGDRFWENYHVDLLVQDLSGQATGPYDVLEIGGELEDGYSTSGTSGYTRRYEFHDDRIVVRVSIDTTDQWIEGLLDRAWENLPFLTSTAAPDCPTTGGYRCGPWAKADGSNVVAADGSCAPLADGAHALDAFALVDANLNGIRVDITRRPAGAEAVIHVRPYGLRFKYYDDPQQQVGRVEIPFDPSANGSPQVLEYTIRPVAPLDCGHGRNSFDHFESNSSAADPVPTQ